MAVEIPDENEHLDYWEHFYRGQSVGLVPRDPSAFARWVADRQCTPGPLIDVGTGNGRDALWFAREGYRVHGVDYAASAVALTSGAASAADLDATFSSLNLYHDDEVSAEAARLATDLAPSAVYARFLVHALEDAGRTNLWRLAQTALSRGGSVYVESRVAETQHAFGEHYRHFVPLETIVAELEAAGARIDHQEQGFGLAVYRDEDPRVCRVVATWGA